jgi:hypothetical protein
MNKNFQKLQSFIKLLRNVKVVGFKSNLFLILDFRVNNKIFKFDDFFLSNK